jgi:hypothetical protein
MLGAVSVGAACLYLIPFVPRGWMPHDEGMLGQSADRVLHGGMPHIDYEEAYAGALSWLYAALFRVDGVDLVHIRWLLLAGACVALILVYAIARRFLRPLGAATATWVALVWSFPNYFAGLPSWWLLICALCCAWAFVRYLETDRLRYLAIGGLAAGIAVAVKQTGLYLAVALVTSIAYAAGPPLLRRAMAPAVALFAAAMLAPRLFQAEGLYLFLPVLACSLALFMAAPSDSTPRFRVSLAALAVASASAAVPVLILLSPYVLRHQLWDFVNGAILAPQKRLAFASMSMPPAWWVITAAPLVALVLVDPERRPFMRSRIAMVSIWTLSLALPIAALVKTAAYQAIWQSTRGFAALLPAVICWRIAAAREMERSERARLFMAASMLAWLSLNQFPFAAPIYFMYVAPLGVVAAVALAERTGALRRETMLPWAALLILFGVLIANRGYIQNLGVAHDPQHFDTRLDLPRAHLRVGAGDARMYRALVASIGSHFPGGRLVAGPDCPEVYFLTGLVSPSGTLFDFLSDEDDDAARRWLTADAIVVNHLPWFSPQVPERLVADLRREFPHGERVGRFEIRWR